jgi:hypothetical protein
MSGPNIVPECQATRHSAQKRWPSRLACLNCSNPDTVTDFFLGVDEGVAREIFRPSTRGPSALPCGACTCGAPAGQQPSPRLRLPPGGLDVRAPDLPGATA